ncbi:MAG: SsrA-binding protein SmpB [Actinomyces sp.]|nr:MAG: SsrA-binding protein SmpB [Actinomyces sp.]
MAARRSKDRLPPGTTLVASNRRARHDFDILDTLEVGIVLRGSEVKSLREARVRLDDAWASVDGGELWLHGLHITPYSRAATAFAPDPGRSRKLLAHRSEIDRLAERLAREPLTLVPLRLYFRDGRAKLELALARGRTKADKRRAIAERDAEREARRAMARARRR